MTTFVDTSALYAYLDADDSFNVAAVRAMHALLDVEQLLTHNYVVVETAALVQRRLGPSVARALLNDLIPLIGVVFVDAETHHAATSAFLAAIERRASLVDWVSFEVMRREGIRRAFTFDRDFAGQGFEMIS